MTWTVDGKTVLITGGNSGIGKETAIALARIGAHVTITARDPERGAAAGRDITAAAGAEVEVRPLDLASFASIRSFAGEFLGHHKQLHVLVNNAGVILSQRTTTAEGFETTFGVNHLGHFLLTDLLLDRIKASAPARIINVASGAHQWARAGLDFDDLQTEHGYGAMKAYARSKLANIYFTVELARRLEGTGVTVNAVHPGGVRTGFARDGDVSGISAFLWKIAGPFLRTPEKGARTSVYAATAPELESDTGKYFADEKDATPTAVAQDAEAAGRLWVESERLVAGRR